MTGPFEVRTPAPSDDFDEDSSRGHDSGDLDDSELLLELPAIGASRPVDLETQDIKSNDFQKSMILAALLENQIRTLRVDMSEQEQDFHLAKTGRDMALMLGDPELMAATSIGMSSHRARYGREVNQAILNKPSALKAGLPSGGAGVLTDVPVLSRTASATSLVHRMPGLKTPSALFFPGQDDFTYPKGVTKTPSMSSMFYTLNVLGKGGFGTVYRVCHKLDKTEYALKIVRLPHTTDPDGKWEKACGEIKAMAKFDHGNIVRYFFSWIDVESAPSLPAHGAKNGGGLSRIVEEGPKAFIEFTADTTADRKLTAVNRLLGVAVSSKSELSDYNRHTMSDDQSESTMENSGDFSDSISRSANESVAVVCKSDSAINDHPSHPASALLKPKNVLHVLMSLYPLTLTDFLGHRAKEKHCFCARSAAEILEGLISGIEYLHRKKLIHRDIKPGNIFLQVSSGQPHRCCGVQGATVIPKIGDFGLVAPMVALGVADPPGRHKKRVGTGFYIPPEGGVHEGVDVWALGIVLFELLYKFGTESERIWVLGALANQAAIPKDFKHDDVAKEIIFGCVNSDPKKRWSLLYVKAKVHRWLRTLREGDLEAI